MNNFKSYRQVEGILWKACKDQQRLRAVVLNWGPRNPWVSWKFLGVPPVYERDMFLDVNSKMKERCPKSKKAENYWLRGQCANIGNAGTAKVWLNIVDAWICGNTYDVPEMSDISLIASAYLEMCEVSTIAFTFPEMYGVSANPHKAFPYLNV